MQKKSAKVFPKGYLKSVEMLSRRGTDVADENTGGIVCWQASHQAKPG
jgi:hypothetical protein